MKRITIIISLLLVILSSQTSLHAADYLARAVVASVTGTAKYFSDMQRGTVTKGLALPQSYTLKTGKDSTVDLLLTSGIAIRVYPNTTITIGTLDIFSQGLPTKEGSDVFNKRVFLSMTTGDIMVNIPEDTTNIDLQVKTQYALIKANDTSVFKVSSSRSTGEVKSGGGVVFVTSADQQRTEVSKGESMILTKAGNIIEPLPSTQELEEYAQATTQTIKKILTLATTTQTQAMLDAIGNEINTETDSKPTPSSETTPADVNEPLPPEPIDNGDPSESEPTA